MIKQDSRTFLSRSGAELFSTTYFNKKSSEYDYHFVFQHGALDHHSFHHRFYDFLLESFPHSCVSSYDLPGHGKSGGARAYIDEFDSYIRDLGFFVDLISGEYRAKKLILIGYSMGGLIGIDYIKQNHINMFDGLILVNPCLKLGTSSFGMALEKLHLKDLGVLSKVKIPTLGDSSELTNDDEILKEIRADKLRCDSISYRMLQQLVSRSQQIRRAPVENSIPILFLISGADTVVDPRINRIYASGLKKDSICIKWYEHAKHNLLNEVNRAQAYNDISEWVRGSLS